ncbi:MAG: cupin protein [Spirosoma sp.]|nr:cupin protein [Spirosoma sp.]
MTYLLKNASLPPHYKNGTGGSKTMVLADLTEKKVICKTFLPGDRMAPHHAPTDVFVLVLDGQMDISLEDETNRFVAGDYVVFPAGMTHALTCIETARLLIYR